MMSSLATFGTTLLDYSLYDLVSFDTQANFKRNLTARLHIWVLEGILKQGLAIDCLESLATKYFRIGLVPQTYLLPELYKFSL